MRKALSFIAGLLCVAVIICAPFLMSAEPQISETESVILTVWHVDAFEGGKGSRYTFLRNISTAFSNKNKGVYVLVSNYTIEGLNEALNAGNLPDLISFGGVGLELNKRAKEITASVEDGGNLNGKRYAVSYLKGGYFLIKKGSGDKKLILSKGSNTSPEIAYLFSGLNNKDYLIKDNQDAYSTFLQSKDATLIGTQRDVVKLQNASVEFTATPIVEYNDLYQYVSLTSTVEVNEIYARRFINYLLSSEVQEKVSSLCMVSATKKGLYSDNEFLSSLENAKTSYTMSPFIEREAYEEICKSSLDIINKGGSYQEISSFLKQL